MLSQERQRLWKEHVCVCLPANHFDVIRRQGWPGSSLRTPLHPQVELHVTLRTLDCTQARVVLWSSKPDIHRVSEGDLVLLDGNSDRSDFVKDQVGGGIAWEKGDGRIIDEQGEQHPFCCLSLLHHGKPMLIYRSNPLVCWWSVTNCIVNNLNGTG